LRLGNLLMMLTAIHSDPRVIASRTCGAAIQRPRLLPQSCRAVLRGGIQPRPEAPDEAPNEAQGLAEVVARRKQVALLPGTPMR